MALGSEQAFVCLSTCSVFCDARLHRDSWSVPDIATIADRSLTGTLVHVETGWLDSTYVRESKQANIEALSSPDSILSRQVDGCLCFSSSRPTPATFSPQVGIYTRNHDAWSIRPSHPVLPRHLSLPCLAGASSTCLPPPPPPLT
ncbi:hypothetical protein LY78DRAFT_345188 [Colletotrichum sublineola]|nr:hypothetical protein LY78DRAFT_345188 [Colletotrichum sublineola]